MRRDHGPARARRTTWDVPRPGAECDQDVGLMPQDPIFAARRVELILQQLDALPTLGPVAVRLLQLTSDDDSQAREVIELITCDPALSARVVKLCRCDARGRGFDVTTVERAVMLMGFDAIRSAALSVQVFEIFDRVHSPGGEMRGHVPEAAFDRAMFWRHSLAVARVCESLAGAGDCRHISKADAFVSGLLHDLGMLALHVLLPRTFDRVCAFADAQVISLGQACRRMIGLDTHTVGRRLAEHWRLPHALGDVLWLHGQPIESIPALPHRAQIALVTLADVIARSQGIAASGDGPRGEDIHELAARLGIDAAAIDDCSRTLRADVDRWAQSIGIHQPLDVEALLVSMSRANQALGRMNAALRRRAIQAQQQSVTLRAITNFYDSASPSGSVVAVMGKVVESAAGLLGGGFFAVLYQARVNEPWQLIQYSSDGRPLRSELISPPPGSTAVSDLADSTQVSMQVMAMLPWLCDYLGDARDLRDMQLLPLRCGWGVNAVLLHEGTVDGQEAREQLEALSRTWAAAIAAAAQHQGAKALGEQLAEANRVLIEAQAELTRNQALAALGEIAAGAAHEMNNPLTVISGRSQLLARAVTNPEHKAMAEQIADQSHRISDMITALRRFAEPTRPRIGPVDLPQLLDAVVAEAQAGYETPPPVKVVIEAGLPPAYIDCDQIGQALRELLRNAMESEKCAQIEVRVQIEPVNDRLKISVSDDGSGLTQHELAHAFDPFFSSKPAGRQPGLGLAQARRWVEAHGGQITLENGKSKGAVATLRLPDWRGPDADAMPQRGAA